MSKRLFVGGLPFSVTSSQLEEMFSKFGKVNSADVITDRDSGRSKGFGFVEMEKVDEAEEAIKKLNETELEGRKIAVNEARPREERRDYNTGNNRTHHRRSRGGGRRY